MRDIIKGLGLGLIGGLAGLAGMRLGQRLTQPFVKKRAPQRTDVFPSQRSMSLIGPQHHPDEGATDAIARIAYEKVVHREPSPKDKKRLSWLVHVVYGLTVGAVYGAMQQAPRRCHATNPLRSGLLLGTALWLFGDELAVPLLGFTDKPTAYHPTQHLQSLVAHLGYGLATAETTLALRRV